MPGAGNLDRRVTIERATVTQDPFGGDQMAWATLGTVWASVLYLSDAERLSASQVNATVEARFTFRSSTVTRTVTAKDRINYDGALWDLSAPKPTKEGRNRFIEVRGMRRDD